MCSKINTGSTLFICEGKTYEDDKVKCNKIHTDVKGVDHVTQSVEVFRRITKDECKAKLNTYKDKGKLAMAAQWIPGKCVVDTKSKEALEKFSDTVPVIKHDYQPRGEAYTYREYSCPGGYTLQHGMEFDKDYIVNRCGPQSWQMKSPLIHDTVNYGALSEEDRKCCDGHDVCYAAYDINGKSLIENNRVSNERCEKEFHACMMDGKSHTGLGKFLPTVTSVGSPSFYTIAWYGKKMLYCSKPETFNENDAKLFCQTYDESRLECNDNDNCKYEGTVSDKGTCYTYKYWCSKDIFGNQVISKDFFTAIEDFFSGVGDVFKIR